MKPGLIKVVFPPSLRFHNNNPYAGLQFNSIADYTEYVTRCVPLEGLNRRRLGLYMEVEDSCTRNHWIVLAGQPFNIQVPPPQCINTLMTNLGATSDQLPNTSRPRLKCTTSGSSSAASTRPGKT